MFGIGTKMLSAYDTDLANLNAKRKTENPLVLTSLPGKPGLGVLQINMALPMSACLKVIELIRQEQEGDA